MITGSLVAIITPMREDGALDFARFRQLIDWHVAEGTDGIVVVGTTGESPTVNFDEHKELIRIAVEHVFPTWLVLEALADPAWRALQAEWEAGRLSGAACMQSQVGLIGGGASDLVRANYG